MVRKTIKRGLGLQRGFTYVVVLLLLALHGAVLAVTGTLWHIAQKREKERELLFVGDQFRRAIRSYAASGPGTAGQLPGSLDDLLLDPRAPVVKRHLRRIYLDPMTGTKDWGLVMTPDGKAIVGVYSHSREAPLKTGNFSAGDEDFENAAGYSDWKFLYRPATRSSPAATKDAGTSRVKNSVSFHNAE